MTLPQAQTPYYIYDTKLLRQTLTTMKAEMQRLSPWQCQMHYAIKANANPQLLDIISKEGTGADCVSGQEIEAALKAGFQPLGIVFAGVGKTDSEISTALDAGILCLNVESLPELEVINHIAAQKGKKAPVCIRLNPDVQAHTHDHITTGRAEDKFGIDKRHLPQVMEAISHMPNIHFLGLHFHIGSQLLEMDDFQKLSLEINKIQDEMDKAGKQPRIINVGGGLGVDYDNPKDNPLPNFRDYFQAFKTTLQLRPSQQLHFELGRAIVAQCGQLITKVLYVKKAESKTFVITDAGMTELIRPALYGALHHIENLTAHQQNPHYYDVVGPICESTDTFARDYQLPETQRGDLLAIHTTGAYGETMASQYNLRPLPKAYYI